MKWLLCLGLLYVVFVITRTKPLTQKHELVDVKEGVNEEDSEQNTGLLYDRYLKEVVSALETDPDFKKKLEEANVSDIKSGEIAKHLDLVNHQVRTKLDEIKRREVERLLELRRLQMKQMQGTEMLHYIAYHAGVDRMHIPTHLDIGNPHSFEMKDLEQLIRKTTQDLEELDKMRDAEFKQYEMEKEFEKKQHLASLTEEERKKEEERLEALKKKHKEHPRLNHPGSKDQFEEVWHEQDRIDKDQEFDPKSFFMMHDTTGDGVWDINEVEALLNIELGKVYDDRNPSDEDDPNEREHERMRMRQHIMTEMDKNHDEMITRDEFLNYTGIHGEKEEFKKDEGWKEEGDDDMFTDEEYEKFLKQYHAQEAQPGVVQPPHDPNVMNMHQGSMGLPIGVDPNLHFQPQGQHPQGMEQPHGQPQQQAQFGQPLHQQQQQQQQLNEHQQMAQQHVQMAENLAQHAAQAAQHFGQAGQPVPTGQPVHPGQPVQAGQPVQSGQPVQTGQPVQAGQPVPTGQQPPQGVPVHHPQEIHNQQQQQQIHEQQQQQIHEQQQLHHQQQQILQQQQQLHQQQQQHHAQQQQAPGHV
ncbi:nucleobindin-2-like isoform X2 [Gigantopelta aegis]|uniref:nucleobindin-2-like isoform X2 n=1 Tax=Gigantopelta aegis TaxID=1735272 RepID=UPI001B88A813|nr:nucleobindin-2-like isoform X2 [Gigantopelta aegis]